MHAFGFSNPLGSGSIWNVLTRRNESILWLLLLLVASFLRLAPIGASLPYIDYVDEGYALHQAIRVLNQRTLDTGWYGYPSLPAYLSAAALIVWNPIYRNAHGHSFRDDLPRDDEAQTPSGYNYDLIAPSELILAGRLIAAALSVGTVALAGVVAFKLEGRFAALVAILLAALCPALVLRGSNVIVDTFATFFVLLALYFCERFRVAAERVALSVAAAGLSAGLAFASKYTAGLVFVAIVLQVWMIPLAKAARVRLTAFAFAGLTLGILTGAPATFFHWPTVMRDVAVTAGNYRIIASRPGYFGQAVDSAELGWILALAGVIGLVLMVRRASTRPSALAWLVFVFALLAIFVGKPFQPFRNLLPVAPLFCIAGAIAFSRLLEQPARWRVRLTAAILLISATAGASAFASWSRIQFRMTHRDSRLQAIDWLRQRVSKDDKVLVIRELAVLPAERKRLAANSTVAPLCEASEALEREHFDFVLTGEFDIRHALDRDTTAACLARWKEKTNALVPAADFGSGPSFVVPYVWRTNDQHIVILRPNPSD
jgi:hypothetical protein